MFVKICGMTSAVAIDAALEAGVDAIGFVFAASPRAVSPEQAAALCRAVPPQVKRVAVMRHPEREQWQRVLEVLAPDWLQTDAEDFDAIELPPGCEALPVYREGTLRPFAAGTLPPRFLYEGAESGTGRTADWAEAQALAATAQLILAGGLHAGNVVTAIERVRPYGVDVSSGVELRRGEKDPAKIKDFVARVRALEAS